MVTIEAYVFLQEDCGCYVQSAVMHYPAGKRYWASYKERGVPVAATATVSRTRTTGYRLLCKIESQTKKLRHRAVEHGTDVAGLTLSSYRRHMRTR
ncbi:hypothetical protein TNCV_2703761 [Trichonephila clavipes]|nr:hypothetical protein TNCV_2703761 [Trichonephila clavipes]